MIRLTNNHSEKDQWATYRQRALIIQRLFNFQKEDLQQSQAIIKSNQGRIKIKSIKWFLPTFDNIYQGGIYTIFRFADFFSRQYDVANSFIIFSSPIPGLRKQKALVNKVFPSLKNSPIEAIDNTEKAKRLSHTDASVCTFWSTAYLALKDNRTRRKFYFIQDYEPLFYPAGSISGLAKTTYNFGFYGVANTVTLKKIYRSWHNGIACHFDPCVDTTIFYPRRDSLVKRKQPFKVFFYGRPAMPRNGFELGITALKRLKLQLKNEIEIVTAGANWPLQNYGLKGIIKNLGVLSLRQTAALYRNCDLGLSFMFTSHPSYIPLELMASKCAVVANENPANQWLLKNGKTCFLATPSPDCLAETTLFALKNKSLRDKITSQAFKLISQKYSDWDSQIKKIYQYMCFPHNEAKKI